MNIVYEHYRIDRVTGKLKRYRRGESQLSKSNPGTWSPAERGGRTVCIILPEGEDVKFCSAADILGIGAADCSLKDVFNYRLGRIIALGRAMKDMEKRQDKAKRPTAFQQMARGEWR